MKRIYIALLVIASSLAISCNFMRNQVPADGSRTITLKNNTIDIQYWLGSSPEATDKDSYQLYIKSDSLSNFSKIATDFLNKTFEPKNIQAITVYTDTIFNDKSVTLLPANISGVQVYYLEDTYLKTKVYKHTANYQLQEINPLSSFVDYFSPNDIKDTSVIFHTDKNSILILVNAEITAKYETGKSDYDKNLADYKLNNK